MTKKLEYANPFYYCSLKQELDEPTAINECIMTPNPNCRGCLERSELEQKVAYYRMRAREGMPRPQLPAGHHLRRQPT